MIVNASACDFGHMSSAESVAFRLRISAIHRFLMRPESPHAIRTDWSEQLGCQPVRMAFKKKARWKRRAFALGIHF